MNLLHPKNIQTEWNSLAKEDKWFIGCCLYVCKLREDEKFLCPNRVYWFYVYNIRYLEDLDKMRLTCLVMAMTCVEWRITMDQVSLGNIDIGYEMAFHIKVSKL